MPRNFDRRIEAAAPVPDPTQRQAVCSLLEGMWQDNRQAWDLQPDGSYDRRHPAPGTPERSVQRMLSERNGAPA
jgi:polyphosphate kinase